MVLVYKDFFSLKDLFGKIYSRFKILVLNFEL